MLKSARGFTLIEIFITAVILVVALCGFLASYFNMLILTDIARGFTLTTNAIQAKMEEIKEANFDNLLALNGTTFDIAGFTSSDAKGVIEVTNTSYPDLMRVRLVASFKCRKRVIGEDKDLNGILTPQEDTMIANNRLDSPAELVTLIAR